MNKPQPYVSTVDKFQAAYTECMSQARLYASESSNGDAASASPRARMALNGAAEVYKTLQLERGQDEESAKSLLNIARKLILGVPLVLGISRDDPIIKKVYGSQSFNKYSFRYLGARPEDFESRIKSLERSLNKSKDLEDVLDDAEILKWDIDQFSKGYFTQQHAKRKKQNQKRVYVIESRAKARLWYNPAETFVVTEERSEEVRRKAKEKDKKLERSALGKVNPAAFFVSKPSGEDIAEEAIVYTFTQYGNITNIETGESDARQRLFLTEVGVPPFFADPGLYSNYLSSLVNEVRSIFSRTANMAGSARLAINPVKSIFYISRSKHKRVHRTLTELGAKPIQEYEADAILYEVPLRQPSGRIRMVKLNGTEFTNGPTGRSKRKGKKGKAKRKRAKK